MKTKMDNNKTNTPPLTRKEFKEAISKLTRNELIGLICDIYYAHSKDGKGGCECDCDCDFVCDASEPKKTSKIAKVSKASKIAKKPARR